MSLQVLAQRVKNAAGEINLAGTAQKNELLAAIAAGLRKEMAIILAANAQDVERGKENGLTESLIDRLTLTESRLEAIAAAVEELIALPDPVGMVLGGMERPNGLHIRQVRVPMGVVGMIYEARPNVTVDAAALCIKSGNACILRGGKEAIATNLALVACMHKAIIACGLSPDIVGFVEDTNRESALGLMKLNGYLDLLIPRGGAGLIQSVVQNATVPIIETGVGNCHIFVDESAQLPMAVAITDNAKTQRPSVCNAAESLLVHEKVAAEFLPLLQMTLGTRCALRGCPKTMAILGDKAIPATEEDYSTEYNDYILAVKVVADIEEALAHIVLYSTRHSEAIVTESYQNAALFTKSVDAAAVYVNASTRFTDGGEFGFGAEIGISTQKLHARGPMGLSELTTYKYIIEGQGQIRP